MCIRDSLSTFSAHMTQVISIIKHCGPNDLVLLDELGSGTDPEEGSALAVSILEFFRKKGALMMVSTHYNELKNYAYHTEGIENGHVAVSYTHLDVYKRQRYRSLKSNRNGIWNEYNCICSNNHNVLCLFHGYWFDFWYIPSP